MNELVMTKRDKFRRLFSTLNDWCSINGYFRRLGGNLESRFDADEKKVKEKLDKIYANCRTDKFSNDSKYDTYIEVTLSFMKGIVNRHLEVPVTYANGYLLNDTGIFNEDIFGYLKWKEVESWKLGSKFKCVLSDGTRVERIPLEYTKEGDWKNHLYGSLHLIPLEHLSEELAYMGEGLYLIDGYRFDVSERGSMRIKMLAKQQYTHPISILVSEASYGINRQSSYGDDEYTCSRCRGGGCPSCDTSGFFTGIRVN